MKLTKISSTTSSILALLAGAILTHAQPAAPAPALATPLKSLWEASASTGLTLTRGNSDTLQFTADILAERKWLKNHLELGADATYGESKGTKNSEATHGFAQFSRLLSDRAYGFGRADALHDSVADVEYRLSLSPGAGYHFIQTDRLKLRAEAGPGFVMEHQGAKTTEYATARFAEMLKFKLTERARLWQSVEIQPQLDHLKNFTVKAELGVEADLTQRWSLRSFVQDNYDHEPAAGRKKNDVRLVTALACKF